MNPVTPDRALQDPERLAALEARVGVNGGLMVAGLAGVLIVVLFFLRFVALTGLPLWVLSAQAPAQALIAVAVTVATGGTLPFSSLLAIVLIVAGEVLVTWPAVRTGS